MKFITMLVCLLPALCVAEALPVGYAQRNNQAALQQQPLQPVPQQRLSPVNSFSTGSGSIPSTDNNEKEKSKSKLSSLLSLSSKPKFTCHSRDTTSSLSSLATYLTDLVKRYRDELFDRKSANTPNFEICLGGWGDNAADKPSIYFKEMTKRQVEKIEELVKSQVLPIFAGVQVKRTSDKGLVILREGDGIATPERRISY